MAATGAGNQSGVTEPSDHASPPPPSAHPAGMSLAEVLQRFAAEGYRADFELDDDTGAVTCISCSTTTPPEQVEVAASRRVEGASDPADMAIVLGARCPSCDSRGVIICRYGPEASAGDAKLLEITRDGGDGRDRTIPS